MPTQRELLEATVEAVNALQKRSNKLQKIEAHLKEQQQRERVQETASLIGETEPEE